MVSAELTTKLSPDSVRAFDDYVRTAEAGLDWHQHVPLDKHHITMTPGFRSPLVELPDAMIHDWVGAVLVRHATVEQVLAVLQSYDDYKRVYAPQITDSKVFSHLDNHWKIYLKLYKKDLFTTNLASEYDVEYRPLTGARWGMLSRSTKIAEEEDGVLLPEGTGHGFLWRLNAYWLLEPRAEGVYVECRAISMSRDVPAGLGWALKGVVSRVPRESLRNTLEATVRALNERAK